MPEGVTMKDGGLVALIAAAVPALLMVTLLFAVVDLQKRLLIVEGRISAMKAAQTCTQEVEP